MFDVSQDRYLALAAGSGSAELYIAEKLGIPFKNIIAVDPFPEISEEDVLVVEEDLVNYLLESKTKGYTYKLVSALGIDFLTQEYKVIEALFQLVSKVMKSGGYFILTESPSNEFSAAAQENGFKRVQTGVYKFQS